MQSDTILKKIEVKFELPFFAEAKALKAKTIINLQVGVFHRRSKAVRAQRRITTKLKLPVMIVQEWEYYVVIITGFNTREDIYKYYPVLAALGYPKSNIIENNNKKP